MKKMLPVFLLLLLACICVDGQERVSSSAGQKDAKNNIVAAGIAVPLGYFSETHMPGLVLEYGWSKGRFGRTAGKFSKRIAFAAHGGAEYYFGRKETISSYSYKYTGFVFLYLFSGIQLNPGPKTGIRLTVGPALGIYAGVSRFNIGADLSTSYYINNRVAVTPGILLRKEPGAAALWSAVVKSSFAF